MINVTFILFLFLFISYKKLLLLNEEFLILLCFLLFVWLNFNNYKEKINNYFNEEVIKIELILKNSFKELLKLLKKFLIIKKTSILILSKFKVWGAYYYNLITLIGYKLPNKRKKQLNFMYQKRLLYIYKIEQQTLKILAIIIIRNLNKIVFLKQFYSSILKINYFISLNSIYFRECIQNIKLK